MRLYHRHFFLNLLKRHFGKKSVGQVLSDTFLINVVCNKVCHSDQTGNKVVNIEHFPVTKGKLINSANNKKTRTQKIKWK